VIFFQIKFTIRSGSLLLLLTFNALKLAVSTQQETDHDQK